MGLLKIVGKTIGTATLVVTGTTSTILKGVSDAVGFEIGSELLGSAKDASFNGIRSMWSSKDLEKDIAKSNKLESGTQAAIHNNAAQTAKKMAETAKRAADIARKNNDDEKYEACMLKYETYMSKYEELKELAECSRENHDNVCTEYDEMYKQNTTIINDENSKDDDEDESYYYN